MAGWIFPDMRFVRIRVWFLNMAGALTTAAISGIFGLWIRFSGFGLQTCKPTTKANPRCSTFIKCNISLCHSDLWNIFRYNQQTKNFLSERWYVLFSFQHEMFPRFPTDLLCLMMIFINGVIWITKLNANEFLILFIICVLHLLLLNPFWIRFNSSGLDGQAISSLQSEYPSDLLQADSLTWAKEHIFQKDPAYIFSKT